MPTDHTIEAHFKVAAGAGIGAPLSLEDRIVNHMVQALCGPDAGNFNVIRAENDCRFIYRAVTAMREALAKEQG